MDLYSPLTIGSWFFSPFLNSLGLGYRFYLRYFTTHAEETVLFAEVS